MLKPVLTNLDLILRVNQKYPTIPITAYPVSSEYAMIKLLGEYEPMNENVLLMETSNSIKRDGAGIILTYPALEATKLLKEKDKIFRIQSLNYRRVREF